MRYILLAVAVAGIAGMPGCGDSGTTTTAPSTGPSAGRAMEKVREAGREIRDVTTRGVEKADAALERAAEKGREMVHTAASRLAESTEPTTQPVITEPPLPSTMPVTPP